MGYRHTDVDENGRPAGRGEICFRGLTCFDHYYKVDDMSGTIDADKWVHTGDIVILRENGSVKIIDRIKNLFKLS